MKPANTKPSRRRKAGELTPEQARAALVRWYSILQADWQSEMTSPNQDWVRLFRLHYDLLLLEREVPNIAAEVEHGA